MIENLNQLANKRSTDIDSPNNDSSDSIASLEVSVVIDTTEVATESKEDTRCYSSKSTINILFSKKDKDMQTNNQDTKLEILR